MPVEIGFHGAAGGVTGSCYRIVHAGGVLLVDCGLFQGSRTVDELNRRPFPFDPAEPAAVLLTHAHIDHAGLLPRLVAHGFARTVVRDRRHRRPPVHWRSCPDTWRIQEGEADAPQPPQTIPAAGDIWCGRRYPCRCRGPRLEQGWPPSTYRAWIDVVPGVGAVVWMPGHILRLRLDRAGVDEAGTALRISVFSRLTSAPGDRAVPSRPEAPRRRLDHLILEST